MPFCLASFFDTFFFFFSFGLFSFLPSQKPWKLFKFRLLSVNQKAKEKKKLFKKILSLNQRSASVRLSPCLAVSLSLCLSLR